MTKEDVRELLESYRDYEQDKKLVRELVRDERQREQELELMEQVHRATMDAVNALHYRDKRIIADRILNGWRWPKITMERHLDESTARRYMNHGLDRMADILSSHRDVEAFLERRRAGKVSIKKRPV